MKKFSILILIWLAAFQTLVAQSEGNIVVAISPELPAVDVLVSEMQADSKIVFFNQAEDPFELLTKSLRAHQPVKVLHVLTESTSGVILFQGIPYPLDSLIAKQELLGSWQQYFIEHGDIMLYGCELGKGDVGLNFVQNMAILTGLDVAASRDMTGAAQAGADWNLEVLSGKIESKLVVSRYIDDVYTTVLRGESYNSTKRKRRSPQTKTVVSSASASSIVEP